MGNFISRRKKYGEISGDELNDMLLNIIKGTKQTIDNNEYRALKKYIKKDKPMLYIIESAYKDSRD